MIPTRIVAIGASSVYGRVDPEGGGFIGRLRSWHELQSPKNLLFNLGVGGDWSEGILQRLHSEASFRKPDLILIQTGVNDCRRVGSIETAPMCEIDTFTENIRKILSLAQKIASVAVVSVYPFDDSKTQPLQNSESFYYLMEDIKGYEGRTKILCSNAGIPYLDIFSEWLTLNYQSLLAEDGFHANSAGHELLFMKVREFLLDIFKEL